MTDKRHPFDVDGLVAGFGSKDSIKEALATSLRGGIKTAIPSLNEAQRAIAADKLALHLMRSGWGMTKRAPAPPHSTP